MSGELARVCAGLSVRPEFREFVEAELLPDLNIDSTQFWRELARLIEELTPENRELLRIRDELQRRIDAFHRQRRGQAWDAQRYKRFLEEIGYLESRGRPFRISTRNVDREIAKVAGPQLVVPVSNARFALNAANARWGSLYDALYGTDVIASKDGCMRGSGYNPKRGAAVIAYVANFLDQVVPLASGSHASVVKYSIENPTGCARISAYLEDGTRTVLESPGQFAGHRIEGYKQSVLMKHHELHIEMQFDPDHPIGKQSLSNLSDVFLEAAVTTIQDCEDSVAAVDAVDKVNVYRNWLGLMRGTLSATLEKNGKTITRVLNPDREYTAPDGKAFTISGRSLMLVRNVGHLTTTDAVLDSNGRDVFEGFLDAVVTVACALYDIRGLGTSTNSHCGSIYIVKPKMHGTREIAFANTLFARVEEMFGLEKCTIKIGVMDEERRTSVNLEECIRQVRDRLVFINTGFLDRTGDEIHTSMLAGPMLPKEVIKTQPWIRAYEDRNVDVGIRCGLPGIGQVGKGMWPKPDEMKAMVETKQAHPQAGASCAWVPSPTAATLHAMHYHHVDVGKVQNEIAGRKEASLDDMLIPPLGNVGELSAAEISAELENNAQGILGYVVRWINQGIGCSKVPDISGVALMEDRATLRISSQHIANWLEHGVCTEDQVLDTFRRMAAVVDAQNVADPAYVAMSPGYDGLAFRAACELALRGRDQPNGYTELILNRRRREQKHSRQRSI